MNRMKAAGFAAALVVSAIVGGTLMSVVTANSGNPSSSSSAGLLTDDSATGAYCQTFLDALAKNLGVDESALVPAGKEAAKATVDKAVANGDLTKEQGDKLKSRIDSFDGTGCGLLGARWRAAIRHGVKVDIGKDMVGAAAGALHLTSDQLVAKLKGGQSLKQIAQAQNVDYATVSKAVHDAAKADLDKLVADGKLNQDREKLILDRLDKALANGRLGIASAFPALRGHGPLSPPSGAASPAAAPGTNSSSSS
jgi:uncharacterized protein YidB (DUF937 family)